MADKKSFILYHSYNDFFSQLSDEEAGQLIKMIFAHELDNENYVPENRVVQMLFVQIKSTLERDRGEYEKTCRKRADNVKKQDDTENTNVLSADTKNTSVFSDDTKNTNVFSKIQNYTNDTDNDNVNVNENVNENDNVNVNVNDNVHVRAETDTDETKTYGHFVKLTKAQHSQLMEEYGMTAVTKYIERVDKYIEQSGSRPYDNHFETLRSWLEKDGVKKLSDSGANQHSYNLEKLVQYAMNHTPKYPSG